MATPNLLAMSALNCALAIFWLLVVIVGKNWSRPAFAASSMTCRTGALSSPHIPTTNGATVKPRAMVDSDEGLSSAAVQVSGGEWWGEFLSCSMFRGAV